MNESSRVAGRVLHGHPSEGSRWLERLPARASSDAQAEGLGYISCVADAFTTFLGATLAGFGEGSAWSRAFFHTAGIAAGLVVWLAVNLAVVWLMATCVRWLVVNDGGVSVTVARVGLWGAVLLRCVVVMLNVALLLSWAVR